MLSIEESDKLFISFFADIVTTDSALPSSYKRIYLERYLPNLEIEARDNSTTATYLIYEYYRMSDPQSKNYQTWAKRASKLGVEKAQLDLASINQGENLNARNLGAFLVVISLIVLLVAVKYFRLNK